MEKFAALLILRSTKSFPELQALLDGFCRQYSIAEAARPEDIDACFRQRRPEVILLEAHPDCFACLPQEQLRANLPLLLISAPDHLEELASLEPDSYSGVLPWPAPAEVIRKTLAMAVAAGGNGAAPVSPVAQTKKKRYQSLFENSHDAIFIHDLDGRILAVNRRAVELFGYTREEFFQKRVPELHEESVWMEMKKGFDLIQKQGYVNFETTFLRKEGSTFPAEVSASLYEEQDQFVIQGIVRDISARKQIEKELTRSESLYRSLVESSPVAIAIHYDTILTYVNPKALKLIGAASFEEIAGKSIFDFIHPDSMAEVRQLYQEFKSSGPVQRPAELKIQRLDGEARYIKLSSIRINTVDKSSAQIVIWDITEEKVLRQALQASEHEYQTLFEKANDAILILSPADEQVLEVNQQACRMYGYSREEFLGLSLRTISENSARGDYFLKSTINSDDTLHFETRQYRKNGVLMEVDVKASVVHYKGQKAILSINRDVSEQKRIERVIREAEERFRLAAQCASDLIYEWDPATGRLEWFGDVEKVLGYHGTYPRYLNAWGERVHPDDLKRLAPQIKKYRETAGTIDVEYRIRHEDGSWLHWQNRGMAISDEQGRPVKYVGVISDVTRERIAEKALRESENRLSVAVESTGLGIWDYYFDSGKTIRNRQWAEMLGYTLEEVEDNLDFWKSHLHPADLPRTLQTLEEHHLGNTEIFRIEHRMRTKDGRYIWVLNWGRIVERDKDGKPLRAVGTHLDITDMKNVEEALRASEDRYRQFFELGLTADYISTPAGEIVTCNPAFIRMFGFDDLADARQFNMVQFYPQESDREQFLFLIREQCRIENQELVLKRKNGELVQVVESAVGSFNDDGELEVIHGFIMDMTEQRRLESQMRQAQKMEAIGTLAGGIAHDFNNILAAILGYSELTLDDLPKESIAYKNIKSIHAAGTRAKELVQQILTFSRGTEQQLKPVQISLLVNEALKLLEASLPATIKLVRQIEKSTLTVLSDPSQIHQVVMNLCTNAYQAMGESGGVLRVGLRETEVDRAAAAKQPGRKPGRYLLLTVNDTGRGMDESTLQRIFDPFFTTKDVGKGTGLGLSVVHGVVKNIGGFVEVSSRPGRGSQFDVYLPVHKKTASNGPYTPNHVPLGSERVLFIEDDPTLMDLGRRVLESLGYRVEATTNSLDALESFQKSPQKFDLIITDQLMPVMTGSELAIECLNIRQDIPIILMTAYSEEMTPEKALQIGIRHFIYKPINKQELAHAVRHVLTS